MSDDLRRMLKRSGHLASVGSCPHCGELDAGEGPLCAHCGRKVHPYSPEAIDRIATIAQDAFWRAVAEEVPHAKYGDLDVGTAQAFTDAATAAITQWLTYNA